MKYPLNLTQDEYFQDMCAKFSQKTNSLQGSLIDYVITKITRAINGVNEKIIEQKADDMQAKLDKELSGEERIDFNFKYGDCYELKIGSYAALKRIAATHNRNYDEEIELPKLGSPEANSLLALQKEVFALCSSEILAQNSQQIARKQAEERSKKLDNVIQMHTPSPSPKASSEKTVRLEERRVASL